MDIAKHFHMNWINGETETRANERRVKTNDEKKKQKKENESKSLLGNNPKKYILITTKYLSRWIMDM